MIVRLYGIRRRCRYDGVEFRPGDWSLWEAGVGCWKLISVWRSTEERDVALAVMGLKAKGGGKRTADDRLIEVETEALA